MRASISARWGGPPRPGAHSRNRTANRASNEPRNASNFYAMGKIGDRVGGDHGGGVLERRGVVAAGGPGAARRWRCWWGSRRGRRTPLELRQDRSGRDAEGHAVPRG